MAAWALLLSHHHAGDSERCVRLGGLELCRRCLLLWPLTFALIALQMVLHAPAAHEADQLLPLLLLPPVLEFILVELGALAYAPARVAWLGPLLAVALARLLFRHMVQPFDPWTWTVLMGAFLPSLLAALARRRRGTRP
jgi:hypothetical protein